MPHHDDDTRPPFRPAHSLTIDSRRITSIEETLAEIKTALVGNPDLGHVGLVNRVDSIEKKVDAHDRKLLLWGGIMTAAVAAGSFLKERLFRP